MSVWTHIYAYLIVDTCRDQFIDDFESADLTAKELFRHAPQITGDEGPAEVFVNTSNVITGHSQCDMCPYQKRDERGIYCVLEETEPKKKCFSTEDFRKTVCEKNPHQDRKPIVIVTIIGHLRGREKSQTKEEYNNFKKFIRLMHWDIRKSHCEIEGDV